MNKHDMTTYPQKLLKEEQGTTLVELMVALALLVGVLLPAGLFLGYVAYNPMNQQKIYAVGIAQTSLEAMLYEQDYNPIREVIILKPGWRLIEKVIREDKVVHLEVEVQFRERRVVNLKTVRLADE